MPVLAPAADILTRNLPKLFSARAHRAADYAIGASFVLAGAWFWRRNRQAAAASWICAGSMLGLSLLTSYPGHRKRLLDFPAHEKFEVALAAVVATMPEFLKIPGNQARHYFRTKAGILTLVTNLSSFAPPEARNVNQ